MRRLLPLLCLSLGLASAASVAGPPLPVPYQLRTTRTTGDRQVILAAAGRVIDSPVIPGGKTLAVTSLLLVRDMGNGRTLWKRYLGDQYELEAVGADTVELSNVEGPRKWMSVYTLRDGKFCGRAVLVTPTASP